MTKSLVAIMLSLAIMLPSSPVYSAADDKEIKAQRREAQKQRQLEKNERNKNNNEAIKEFRIFVRILKKEYQEKARDMDIEFKLRRVELNAQRSIEMAEAEAELQQSLSQMMLNIQNLNTQEAIDKFKTDMKAHSDKSFEIKKQAALEEHKELIKNENKKSRLMSERDQLIMDEAKTLGLQSKHKPILAQPLGDGLTTSENRWNERELKEVNKIYANNQRQLGEFIWGSKLRKFKIENRQEDFDLKWQKQSELNALSSEQSFFSLLMPMTEGNTQDNQQEMIKRMTEAAKQNKLINIKFKKFRDQNNIKRREQERKIKGR